MTTPDASKVRLEHARAVVTVVGESGTPRLVTVQPRQADLYIQRSPCRTSYPDDLIARLLEIKGPEYVCDEIARDEDPSYAEINLDLGLFSYLRAEEFVGKRLLDFGCGCGSSTMILARRLPETAIVGVELVPESLDAARLRARHYGREDIMFRVSPDGGTLPADLGSVDFIVMNAVFEHLLPAERRPLMARLWSVLRPGGVLFMQETPNRWCPVEMHTTGLPLLNYVGDGLARRLATRYSRRVAPASTWEFLLRDGIRGGSVREILGTLPVSQGRPEMLRPIVPGLAGQADLWYRASVRRHGASTPKNVVRVGLKAARALTTLDFTPELVLAVRKREAPTVA